MSSSNGIAVLIAPLSHHTPEAAVRLRFSVPIVVSFGEAPSMRRR